MMVITRPRQAGKTHDLIKLAHEHGGYVVVIDQSEAQRVFKLSRELEMPVNLPITFKEFLDHKYYGAGVSNFYMDNLDVMIQGLTNNPIYAVTLNATATTEGGEG